MENYIYQVVTTNKGTRMFDYDGLTLNFNVSGTHYSESRRKELQGQPKLLGFNGPMYNGVQDGKTIIRYESPAVYASYSN